MNINNPNNYRGISLMSCINRIVLKIINSRLTSWAKIKSKICDEQAGFTKGKSTLDQILILQALAYNFLSKML